MNHIGGVAKKLIVARFAVFLFIYLILSFIIRNPPLHLLQTAVTGGAKKY